MFQADIEEQEKKPELTNISEIIKKIIEPFDVDVSSIILNDELSQLLWIGDSMIDDIRKKLLENVKTFINFSELHVLKFNDIILTGSMSNYNYTDNSDIDIHIVLDFNQLSEDKKFVKDYLKLKSILWDDTIPVTISGHYIEYYFQDIDEIVHSSGIYSLYKNKWVRKPLKKIINIDTEGIKLKYNYYINKIDELKEIKNLNTFNIKYKELRHKIKRFRQCGLDKAGEYSTENLVFKILRNNGYLDKLVKLKNDKLTAELSIE
jgi:predicted nucleotidyltransferase